MFIARPLSVIITLLPFKFSFKEKLFTSWVGLRGAVPIILATFPLLMGVKNSGIIFDLIFFIVLTSVLVQGWSINFVAKLLKLAAPYQKKIKIPIEYSSDIEGETELMEFVLPYNSKISGKQIVDLNFPEESRIVLIVRDDKNIVPSGGSIIQAGDILSILLNKKNRNEIKNIIS